MYQLDELNHEKIDHHVVESFEHFLCFFSNTAFFLKKKHVEVGLTHTNPSRKVSTSNRFFQKMQRFGDVALRFVLMFPNFAKVSFFSRASLVGPICFPYFLVGHLWCPYFFGGT